MAFVRNVLAAAALACITVASQAAGTTLLTWKTPDNLAATGLSNLATGVVTSSSGTGAIFSQVGNYWLDTQGTASYIGGLGDSGGMISANGNLIGANASIGGKNQASFYNVGTGVWTSAGTLAGGNGASSFRGMSSDGTSIVGYANASGNVNHAFVTRNGQAYDLTPTATTTTTALAASSGGRVVVGFSGNNNTGGTVWTWNSATQSYDAAVQTVVSISGVAGAGVALSAVSANGNWAAGGSTNDNSKASGLFGYFFYAATLTNTLTNTTINIPWDHTLILPTTGVVDPILNWKAAVAGVSDTGTVIGSFNAPSAGNLPSKVTSADAFIYFASTNVSMTFDSYLTSIGAGLTSTQHVYSLTAISADGNNVSGLLYDTSLGTVGQTVAFELQGANISAVPEPGQWALLALGLPLLLARRLRKNEA